MAWRHRGCLKKTTVSLAIVTFGLCNFATFLTRSGIFSSVHAFSQSPIGWMFLGLLAVLLVGGLSLIAWRRRELAAERRIGSLFSRESFVLASIYLLALLTTVVLVGTLYTPLSALVVGRMVQIGPEFYNFVLMPIAVFLLAATSAVPLLRWGAAPRPSQRAALGACGLVGIAVAGIAAGLGVKHPAAIAIAGLAAVTVSAFVAGVLLDVRRHTSKRFLAGAGLVLRANRRQYAGYVVHLAFACIVIGVTGSSLGARRHDVDLNEGEAIDWAGRKIEVVRLVQRAESDKLVAEVELRVSRGSEPPVLLKPARHLHLLQNQWTTEVAIHSTWSGDFYTILHAGLGDGRVAITLIDNPMIRWIWLAGWLAAGGVTVAAWPARGKRIRQGRQVASKQLPATFEPARRRAA
jgi:cytochrome c-type biogenesis protein CcmF